MFLPYSSSEFVGCIRTSAESHIYDLSGPQLNLVYASCTKQASRTLQCLFHQTTFSRSPKRSSVQESLTLANAVTKLGDGTVGDIHIGHNLKHRYINYQSAQREVEEKRPERDVPFFDLVGLSPLSSYCSCCYIVASVIHSPYAACISSHYSISLSASMTLMGACSQDWSNPCEDRSTQTGCTNTLRGRVVLNRTLACKRSVYAIMTS